MSATGPPELDLDAAREHLARKGYLSGALPPESARKPGSWLHLSLIAALLSVLMAWMAVATGEALSEAIPPLAIGLLPLVAVVFVLARLAGTRLAKLGLRLGGGPELVAHVLAGAAGGGVLALLAFAAATRPAAGWSVVFPWLGGLAVAIEATWAARGFLLRRHALVSSASATSPRGLFAALAGVAVLAAILATPRLVARISSSAPAPAAFPPPVGRVAVVAVDGLAREDVTALAAAGDPAWDDVAGWGWGRLALGRPSLPAVLWTTVACGVDPAAHGVVVLDEVRLFGSEHGAPLAGPLRAAIVNGWGSLGAVVVVARPALTRRAPTFWEMASRASCPVLVGGWWGSWPVRRVVGEVASERAWLGGSAGEDAVTPRLAAVVTRAWAGGVSATTATDRLGGELTRRAAAAPAPHLVALWMPSLDLVRRAQPPLPAVAFAARAREHLDAIRDSLATLSNAGVTVWLVAVPWGEGAPFVACSKAEPGEHAAVEIKALAGTWLDQLGLPPPTGAAPPRRDLSGRAGPLAAPSDYGPPPPPLAAPPVRALEVQREVLRSLGYLR